MGGFKDGEGSDMEGIVNEEGAGIVFMTGTFSLKGGPKGLDVNTVQGGDEVGMKGHRTKTEGEEYNKNRGRRIVKNPSPMRTTQKFG